MSESLEGLFGYVADYQKIPDEELRKCAKKRDKFCSRIKSLEKELNRKINGNGKKIKDKIERLKQQELDIANRVVKGNMNLVFFLADVYYNRHPYLSRRNLFSEFQLILWRSWEKWDYKRGAPFSAYTGEAIRYSFLKVLNRFFRDKRIHPISIDELNFLREDNDIEYIAQRDNEDMADPASTYRKDAYEIVRESLNCLTERELTIIKRRFGIDGYKEETLEKIGKGYRVTRERVRQIERKALRKLKKKINWRNILANEKII